MIQFASVARGSVLAKLDAASATRFVVAGDIVTMKSP
jgi:hypothetical protein